uniref:Uncharacterized protein n=1 Tax=Anopheles coluzzii TaxID=1518534 RepID=A0A8W7NXQ5_ANOCL
MSQPTSAPYSVAYTITLWAPWSRGCISTTGPSSGPSSPVELEADTVEQQLRTGQLDQRQAQVGRNRGPHLALHIDRGEDAGGRRHQLDHLVPDPQVRMGEVAGALADKLDRALLLYQPELHQQRGRVDRLRDHELLRIGQALLQQRQQHRRTVPPDVRRDAHDAVEEGAAQMPILLVVQEGDHVRQDDVVRLLPAEEHAQLRDAGRHERLLHRGLRVRQQGQHRLVQHLVQRAQLGFVVRRRHVLRGAGVLRLLEKADRGVGQRCDVARVRHAHEGGVVGGERCDRGQDVLGKDVRVAAGQLAHQPQAAGERVERADADAGRCVLREMQDVGQDAVEYRFGGGVFGQRLQDFEREQLRPAEAEPADAGRDDARDQYQPVVVVVVVGRFGRVVATAAASPAASQYLHDLADVAVQPGDLLVRRHHRHGREHLQVGLQEGVEVLGEQLAPLLVQVQLGRFAIAWIGAEHRLDQLPQPLVLDPVQVLADQVDLAPPVREQLGKLERRGTLGPQLEQRAAGRKDVHLGQQLPGTVLPVADQRPVLRLDRFAAGRAHEPLRRDVARAPPARVEEVAVVGRIVLRQVGLNEAKSDSSTQFHEVIRMFSSLMSPWQIRCLWHWCSAHSIWNVIHFFSISVRNGRVETRSYRLCFTYCRTIRHAFSIVCERVANAEKGWIIFFSMNKVKSTTQICLYQRVGISGGSSESDLPDWIDSQKSNEFQNENQFLN